MIGADRRVRIAARSLAKAGLVHAYGHCSARLSDETFLVCPAKPMGLVSSDDECCTVPVNGGLPDGVLGEVRLHQFIYRARPRAGGVVRFMGPSVMALGALGLVPEIRHGFGTYFAPGVGLWTDIQLVRDNERAQAAIAAMGDGSGLMMQGNGAVTAGETLEDAVVLAWYLEDMCRIELQALATGRANSAKISPADAARRATRKGGIFERMWELLSAGDPEAIAATGKTET